MARSIWGSPYWNPFSMFVGGQEGPSQHRWYRLEPCKRKPKAGTSPNEKSKGSSKGELKPSDDSSKRVQAKVALADNVKDVNVITAAPAEGGNVENWENVDDSGDAQGGLLGQLVGATTQALDGVKSNLGITTSSSKEEFTKDNTDNTEDFDLVEITRTRNYTPSTKDV